MPKFKLKSEFSTEALRILDTDGRADALLLPDLDDERLLQMLKAMIRARRVDEKRLELQRRGDIGTFAPIARPYRARILGVYLMFGLRWFRDNSQRTGVRR